ncbi:extracellular solute-binding protein [Bifidobacterium olomucense]|uniref:LacI family transcriptional regulator n=1 Tax=Bifidobacterium olomucense TaxID=2675324 RepID=A0A7Y0EWC8_9BIFI|nr:extracellular solute-binding protein [Bifidobacterium sp. DSM 109959]NMM97642.1 LacI family transcriptional regulator [Bifidobacterium sp. DSM 109959]
MAQPQHKATIYDIAREAGVNPSTVSRALNQPGRVAAKTEFRIRRIAEQLGYLTISDSDSSAEALPATGMLAAIVPTLTNPLYANVISDMQRRLESKGYGLITLNVNEAPAEERKMMSYAMRNADGVALISPRLSEPDIRRLALVRPVILLNRAIPGLPSVTVDVSRAVDDAVRRLKETGHSSLTYLSGPASSWANEYRRRYIRAAAFRYDMVYRVVRECDPNVGGGTKAVEQYLVHPTDAVIAFNDALASGFIASARRNGLRIPEDVSVIGFDNTQMGSLLTPSLATIDMREDHVAASATDALINAVRNTFVRPAPIVLDASFKSRDSISTHKRSTMKLGPYAEIRRSTDTIVLTVLSNAFNETMPRINEFMRTHPHIVIDPIEGRTQENTLALYWERVINHRSVPDIINVERTALPQLAASGVLQNLSSEHIEKEVGTLVNRAAWQSAHYAGKLYGIPGDQSQTVMFYRADLLERYGLEVPISWDQFYEEGVDLHARNPQRYMGLIDTTNVQHYLATFRSAGVKLWTVENDSTITFHMTDEPARIIADFVQQGLDASVLNAEPMWDNRYMLPKSDTYLTITYANWLGKILASSYPADKGLWKVAMPPSLSDPSQMQTAEIGGSMMAISAGLSKIRQQAAMTFIRWFQLDPASIELRAPGGVSAAAGYVEDLTRRGTVDSYFNQPIYDIYAKSAARVNRDWDNLPFYSQLDAEFARLIVPALRPGGRSPELFGEWERRLKIYATSQGFTVR